MQLVGQPLNLRVLRWGWSIGLELMRCYGQELKKKDQAAKKIKRSKKMGKCPECFPPAKRTGEKEKKLRLRGCEMIGDVTPSTSM